jgi:hypothetical protein
MRVRCGACAKQRLELLEGIGRQQEELGVGGGDCWREPERSCGPAGCPSRQCRRPGGLDAVVIEKADEPFPLLERVTDGLGEARAARDLQQRFLQPGLQCFDQRLGFLTMHVIGEDRSRRLDVIPAQYRVLLTRGLKYACPRMKLGFERMRAAIGMRPAPSPPAPLPLRQRASVYGNGHAPKRKPVMKGRPWGRLIPLLLAALRYDAGNRWNISGSDTVVCPSLQPRRGSLLCPNRCWSRAGPVILAATPVRPWPPPAIRL